MRWLRLSVMDVGARLSNGRPTYGGVITTNAHPGTFSDALDIIDRSGG